MRDGAHTHGSGGVGGLLAAALLVVAAGFAGWMVLRALASLTVAIVGGEVMVVVAVVSLTVLRLRADTAPSRAAVCSDNDSDRMRVNSGRHEPVAAPPRRVALPPAERHEHIHFHGMSPQDVAAIVAARRKETP